MKVFILAVLVCAVAADLKATTLWREFKQTHGKAYSNAKEEQYRFSVFQANLRKIEEHNAKFEQGLTSYKMAMQKYGDLTTEEFFEQVGLRKLNLPEASATELHHVEDSDVPEVVDWRTSGAVTPVKDQGGCGSCWAFSTTGAVESLNYIKNKKLISLSEQNLVDCSVVEDSCMGCNGCWPDFSLRYVKDNGIELEEDYPYEGVDRTCRFDKSKSALQIKDVKRLEESEEVLKKAVAIQPVSICIEVEGAFQFYSSGVLDDPTCDGDVLNHAVLAVGYGTENGKDYWLVKNSWGGSWGEDGYIKMRRNSKNQCGISSYATIPLM